MQEKGYGRWKVSYASFFKCVRYGLSKAIIKDVGSLLLFALRQWGPMYQQEHYHIFSFLLVMAYHKKEPWQFMKTLTPENILNGSILNLIHREPIPILHQDTLEN